MTVYILTWVEYSHKTAHKAILGVYSSHLEAQVACNRYKASLEAPEPFQGTSWPEIVMTDLNNHPIDLKGYPTI